MLQPTHQLESEHVITSISAAHLQPLAFILAHTTWFSITCFKKSKQCINAFLCDSQEKRAIFLYTAVTNRYHTGIYNADTVFCKVGTEFLNIRLCSHLKRMNFFSQFQDVCRNACRSQCEVSTIWFQTMLENATFSQPTLHTQNFMKI